jgi:hypothetical protein
MYHRNQQGQVVGVLNDFDLSVFHLDNSQLSKERTGTVPFMADFLLTGKALTHIYGLSSVSIVPVIHSTLQPFSEFDMESFIYVLLWITRRYGKQGDKVQTIKDPPFQGWLVANALHCASVRHASLLNPQNATAEHQSHNNVVTRLCQYLNFYQIKQDFLWSQHHYAAQFNEVATCPPPAATHDPEREKDTFDACMKIIKEYAPQEYVDTLFNAGRVEQNSTLWEELERRGREGQFWQVKIKSPPKK